MTWVCCTIVDFILPCTSGSMTILTAFEKLFFLGLMKKNTVMSNYVISKYE